MRLTAINFVRPIVSKTARILPQQRTGPDVAWKRQMYRRLAWHMFGRRHNCFRIQIRSVERALRYSSTAGVTRREFFKTLGEKRLNAACWEHGVIYPEFLRTLDKYDIELNRPMLETLAIYEPRTFQSLCELSLASQEEEGIKTKELTTPSGVLTKGLKDKDL